MFKERFISLIKEGKEIEFNYNNKLYSFTFPKDNKDNNQIIFTEFFKRPKILKKIDDVLKIKIDGINLEKILYFINEEDLHIY